MAIRDEIKEQQQKLQGKGMKEKLSYFLYYYKVHIILTLLFLILFGSFAHSLLTAKDTVLYCALISPNFYESEDQTFTDQFAEYAKIDQNKVDITLDTGMQINYDSDDSLTYNYVAKLMAMLSSKTLDCMVSDQKVIENFSTSDAFANLQELLPESIQESLKGRFDYFYAKNEAGEMIPVGIILTNSKILESSNLYKDIDMSKLIFTIAGNSSQIENSIKFLQFLTQ